MTRQRPLLRELDAKETAYDLFGHLKKGDKLAMTSRYNNELTQSYIAAFRERGIEARLVEGGNPGQDFCFLMHAKKELVGPEGSSFTRWAALLGNATSVTLYSMAPGKEEYDFGWKHPTLVNKFKYRHFNVA